MALNGLSYSFSQMLGESSSFLVLIGFFLSTCSPLDWNMCPSTMTTAHRAHNLFCRRKCGVFHVWKYRVTPRKLKFTTLPSRSPTEQLEFVELGFQQGELSRTAPRCSRNGSTWHECYIKSHNPDYACMSRTNAPHICARVHRHMCFSISLESLWLPVRMTPLS